MEQTYQDNAKKKKHKADLYFKPAEMWTLTKRERQKSTFQATDMKLLRSTKGKQEEKESETKSSEKLDSKILVYLRRTENKDTKKDIINNI
jgi:hypothetical protein